MTPFTADRGGGADIASEGVNDQNSAHNGVASRNLRYDVAWRWWPVRKGPTAAGLKKPFSGTVTSA